nr:Putative N-6 DNA Methylase [Faustovirus]
MSDLKSVINSVQPIIAEHGIAIEKNIDQCVFLTVFRCLTSEARASIGIPEELSFTNVMRRENGVLNGQIIFPKIYSLDPETESFFKYYKRQLRMNTFTFELNCAKTLLAILLEFEKLDTSKIHDQFDIIGAIYEIYATKGDKKGKNDLGYHFTPRAFIKYMIELCNPGMVDGRVETILDPTMGVGGFLALSVRHLRRAYPDLSLDHINNALYGFDINGRLQNLAVVNVLMEMDRLPANLFREDTLRNDLLIPGGRPLDKADVILANIPMGDDTIKYKSCCRRIKQVGIAGEYIEPLFIQLMMRALNDNGRCAVIVPNGVLFRVNANIYIDTRRELLLNFNVKKVITLPDGNTETYIIYFEKKGTTQNVDFAELVFDDNGTVHEKFIRTVNIEAILKNNCGLLGKHYAQLELKYNKIKYYKLEQFITFKENPKRLAGWGLPEGKYRFYTCGDDVKYCNVADYDEECIIINTGSNPNVHLDCNFSCSGDHKVIKAIGGNWYPGNAYIYNYLKTNIDVIANGFKGSLKGKGHISIDYIKNILIPLPAPHVIKDMEAKLNCISLINKLLQERIAENLKMIPRIVGDNLQQYNDNNKYVPAKSEFNEQEIREKIRGLNFEF